MVVSLASFVLHLSFAILLLGQLGLALSETTVGWILGSVSLTVVFVARPYLASALAGWSHLARDSYGVGDYLDAGLGVEGTVTDVNLWTTRLLGADGTVWEIDNADLVRFGNRTKSAGRLLIDITLVPADEQFVTSAQLDRWEALIADALVRLRSTLRDMDTLARDSTHKDIDTAALALAVPVLVPNLPADQMAQIKDLSADDTGALPVVRAAIDQAPAGSTPSFRDIEMLGLVSSTPNSATIRVRVVLVDQRTRSYALSALRRAVFDEMNAERVATQFDDVPEGALIG